MRWIGGAALSLALLSSGAAAQEWQGVFYGGLGPASDGEFENDSLPWSIGVIGQAQNSRLVLGFDIAGEGTKLDSTFGGDSLEKALSYNLLVGTNVATNGSTRIDAAFLVGFRESVADCPDSFLGFQCYADSPPEIEYEANYGVMLGVSFSRAMIGLRATGESVQALVGFRF